MVTKPKIPFSTLVHTNFLFPLLTAGTASFTDPAYVTSRVPTREKVTCSITMGWACELLVNNSHERRKIEKEIMMSEGDR